jgi:signal peptidase II
MPDLPAEAEAAARPAVGRPGRRLEIWLPLAVVVLDQLTKAVVRAELSEYDSVTIVPGFMNFIHVRNTGAAFGILDSVDFPFKSVLIAIVATGAMIAVGLYAASLAHHQTVARLGLALIVGGAAGNLIDRVTVGSVIDFVDVYWRTYHFWAFNVADSAITVGVVVMILDMLGVGTDVSKAA